MTGVARIRSLSLRLALLFALATAVVSAISSTSLFLLNMAEFERHNQEELRARFVIVERMIRNSAGGPNWPRVRERLHDFTPHDGSLRFIVDSDDPDYVISRDFLEAARLEGPVDGFGKAYIGQAAYWTLSAAIEAREQRPPVRLIIAISQAPELADRRIMTLGILATALFTILGVAALGGWIARRGLRSVDQLSRAARTLEPGDTASRLPVEHLPSELEGLVLSLNDALDRLQHSHQKLAAFNADVAHELRTPLNNLIGQTQVALSRPRHVGDLEDVLQSNLEDLERLRAIVSDMLFLARADAGAVARNLVHADLTAECRKTADFMEVLCEDAGVRIRIDGAASAWVEPALFGRALSNLLDNAIRHSRPREVVRIGLSERPDGVEVWVANRGDPIPPEDLPRIFDRFYSASPAGRPGGAGHGLGLAIVRAIARMHGGDAQARCEGDEIVVGFSLPLNRPAPGADGDFAPDRSNLDMARHDPSGRAT